MRELKSIEEKILDRTLYLIGKNGSTHVSIRAIAKEANVNVSAVNYYFHTKEEMINQVKEFFITNILSISLILDSKEYDGEERLVLAANEIMEYTLRFPGATVILREASNLKEVDEISMNILKIAKEMHLKMEKTLRDVVNDKSDSFKYKRMIFSSSIIYPIENSDIIDFDKDIINTREGRIEYIKNIIRLLKQS